jgi:outer membrane receptor protein involved in Fe transport
VINLVLRDRDVPEGVRAAISTYDGSTARVRIDGAVRRGAAGAWASLAMARSEGRDEELSFVDDDGDPGPHVARAFDKFHSWTATGKAWWRGLSAQAFFTSRLLTVPTGSFATLFDDPRNQARDERFMLEVKHESRPSARTELELRGYLNAAYYADRLWFAFDEPSPVDQLYAEDYKSRWLGAEARLRWSPSARLALVVGSEVTAHPRVSMVANEAQLDGSIEVPLDVDAPYQVLALSGQLDWRPDPRLSVQAGARFDYWNLSGNQRAAAGEDSIVTSFPALSPRLALIARPSSRDVVKLMAGSAFRAPSAFEFYYEDNEVSIAASDICGETLTPETVYAAELEASRRFGRDWVGLAAAHGTYARGIVESVPVPVEDRCGNADGHIDPEVVYYRNSPVGQVVIGADLELRREWRLGTMLSAQYGVLAARYREAPDPLLDDRAVPNAPTHFASFKGVVPLVPRLVTGALRVTLEDRRRIDPSTTTRTRRAVVADVVLSGTIGRPGLRYAAGVYNLFNWRYALPAVPFASPLMPQAGRSFILSLGYDR